ncbi:hypothetical protein HMPREF0321_0223 [Dermacoccus sp. Ellin185]|nr:hypothetical protein HMPREF0321_0223 [Dermacoccus sp. Ellin185]
MFHVKLGAAEPDGERSPGLSALSPAWTRLDATEMSWPRDQGGAR